MTRLIARVNPWGVMGVLAAFAGWWLLSRRFQSTLFPGPYEAFVAAYTERAAILAEIGVTIRRGLIAFAISVTFMVPFGILCGRVRLLGRIVDPILEFVVAIPGMALIPIVMLLAGVGDAAKISIICYAMVSNVLINTIETVRQQSPTLNQVARSLRLTRFEIMLFVDLPAATPGIITGLRLAINTSLLVGITCEMLLSTDGIGTFLQRSQETFRIGSGLAAIMVIAVTGLALNIGLRKIEERFLFWHYRAAINR